MTEQILDKIIIKHQGIDFCGMNPINVFTGFKGSSTMEEYKIKSIPQQHLEDDMGFCTSLHRGYIATFELTESGELYVVKYDFPFSPRNSIFPNEQIIGDFTLALKDSFYSHHTIYVPFVDSKVIADNDKWIVEDLTEKFYAEMSKNNNTNFNITYKLDDIDNSIG